MTAQPTVVGIGRATPLTETAGGGTGDSKPGHRRSLYQPSGGLQGNREEPRGRQPPARAPRGRGRGWKEKLASGAAARVGRSLDAGITVFEPLDKRLPPERTEDAHASSTSAESPGKTFSSKVPSSALPKRLQLKEDQPREETAMDSATPPPPQDEAQSSIHSSTPTTSSLPPETTVANKEAQESPELERATQTSKPKRYSSRRQRTGAGSEAQDIQPAPSQQQHPVLPSQGLLVCLFGSLLLCMCTILQTRKPESMLCGLYCTLSNCTAMLV